MMRKKILLSFIFAIPLVIMVPGWEGVAFGWRADYSDIGISHYPNAIFLLRGVQSGQLPYWSALIFSGYPFAANPLAGIWYPLSWIAYLFPLPLGFNINTLLHMYFSAWGMFLFLRACGNNDYAALVGTFAWELFPKMFAHFGAGHLTLIYALSWTPWLLLAQNRWMKKNHSAGWFSGLIFGMILLADMRWAAYCGVIWVAFGVWEVLISSEKKVSFRERWLPLVRHFVGNGVLSILISASMWLPLLEFSQLSTRRTMTLLDNFTMQLPIDQLMGFFFPNMGGYAEWVVYPGALLLAVIGYSAFIRKNLKKNAFWLLTILGALLLSVGSAFPLNEFIFRLPGLQLLRVPSRAIFLIGLASAVICANFVNAYWVDQREKNKGEVAANLVIVGLAVFGLAISGILWVVGQTLPLPFVWGAGASLMVMIIIMLRVKGRVSARIWSMSLICVTVLDLGTVAMTQFQYRNRDLVLTEKGQVAAYLASELGGGRVYSLDYILPQQTAALYGIEMINGVDPMQLQGYIDYLDQAVGLKAIGYSVVQPPLKSEAVSITQDARDFHLKLNQLDVRFILTDREQVLAGFEFDRIIDGIYIYQNKDVTSRVWLKHADGEQTAINSDAISVANKLAVNVAGPGDVVFSEIDYPGWSAKVDGIESEIRVEDQLFRSVPISAGDHHVELIFRPTNVFIGLALAVCGWLYIANCLLIGHHRV
jgi:hypothetical protein